MSDLLPDIKFKAKFLDDRLQQFLSQKKKADAAWTNSPIEAVMTAPKKTVSFWKQAPAILTLALRQQILINMLIAVIERRK